MTTRLPAMTTTPVIGSLAQPSETPGGSHDPIRSRQRGLRSKWGLCPLGKVRVTATPSPGLVGCDADAPLPAAMKLPPSMVAVALSGMRTVPGNHSRGRRRTRGWRFP